MSQRKWLAAALAVTGFAAALNAQDAGLQMTNLGEVRSPVFSGHKLTGKAAAQQQLQKARTATRGQANQEPVSVPVDLQLTNTGELRRVVFEGHVLTGGAAEGAPIKVLYAPSEADDAAYRTAIATGIGGGAIVDYFDARVATPSVATMLGYDAVYTWANFAYSNNVLFGDNLAAYNNAGGTVVLGVFCTYTSGNFLSGTIMTSAYCPVDSPFGTNHFSSSTYSGGGTTCIYNGVTTLTSTYRDFLVTQGSGITDGLYPDAEICHAYRGTTGAGQGDVVYSNGAGAIQLGGTGQWGKAVANACFCSLTGAKILYAPSEADDAAYRAAISAAAGGATVDYFDASAGTPSGAVLANYDAVHVWANFAFADNVTYGNNLATFVDGGGDVVMGAFCTYTSGNFLSGTIMTPAYSPVVSPSGSNHFSFSSYTGGGCSCVLTGVSTLGCTYRDFLALQGGGIRDGLFADGEITVAFRRHPGGSVGDVVYSNGAGGFPLDATAEYAETVANAALCNPGQDGPPASSTFRGSTGACGVNPNSYSVTGQPVVGGVFGGSISTTPLIGSATTSTHIGFFVAPSSGTCLGSFELLCGPLIGGSPFFISSSVTSAHNVPIPGNACFIGLPIYTQGLRFESGPPAFVLTNAQDLILGL